MRWDIVFGIGILHQQLVRWSALTWIRRSSEFSKKTNKFQFFFSPSYDSSVLIKHWDEVSNGERNDENILKTEIDSPHDFFENLLVLKVIFQYIRTPSGGWSIELLLWSSYFACLSASGNFKSLPNSLWEILVSSVKKRAIKINLWFIGSKDLYRPVEDENQLKNFFILFQLKNKFEFNEIREERMTFFHHILDVI